MSRRYYHISRNHAIRQHQSGEPIADKIAEAMLLTGLVAILYGMVAYANYRDAKALGNHASFPSRPEEVETVSPDAGRTLIYLEEFPPANG